MYPLSTPPVAVVFPAGPVYPHGIQVASFTPMNHGTHYPGSSLYTRDPWYPRRTRPLAPQYPKLVVVALFTP